MERLRSLRLDDRFYMHQLLSHIGKQSRAFCQSSTASGVVVSTSSLPTRSFTPSLHCFGALELLPRLCPVRGLVYKDENPAIHDHFSKVSPIPWDRRWL